MKAPLQIIRVLVLITLVCLATCSCGMKMKAGGRAVDAVTGQPIEGAAVAIKWVHYKLGPPGLPTPREYLGTTETLTDAQGEFTIPHYLWRTHYMGVYKKGYICWNSEDIFNPYGETYEEMYPRRFWHWVTSNMTIELEPMPDDISPDLRGRHSHFAVDVDTRLDQTDIFSKAIRQERELHRQILRGNKKEK